MQVVTRASSLPSNQVCESPVSHPVALSIVPAVQVGGNPGHVHVKERLFSSDTELLSAGMRHYYLPRKFTSAIIISLYIPPSADAAVACDVSHPAVDQIQTQHSNAFIVITGDFNHLLLAT